MDIEHNNIQHRTLSIVVWTQKCSIAWDGVYQQRTFGLSGAAISQAGCPSCRRPMNDIKALNDVDWGVYHPSPPHFVIRGLKSSFSISANLPTVAFLFFFRTNSTDSADCLPIHVRFLLFSFSLPPFLVFDSLRQIMLTYVSFWARIFSCRIEPFASVERLFHRLTALPVVVQWAMSKRWTTESAV